MNIEMNIEKGKKINPPVRNGRPPVYPFKKMKKGDSFLLDKKGVKAQQSVGNAARQFGSKQKKKWKFVTRTEENGIRVFRTK